MIHIARPGSRLAARSARSYAPPATPQPSSTARDELAIIPSHAEWLRPSCRHVAGLDCDILFENSEWAREALRRLDDTPLVQLCDRVACLAPQPIDGVAG